MEQMKHIMQRLKDYIEKNIESLTMFEPELTSSEIFNRVIKESQFTKIKTISCT